MFRKLIRTVCLLAVGAMPLSDITCVLPESIYWFGDDDYDDDWYCCGGYDVYYDYYEPYGYYDEYYY